MTSRYRQIRRWGLCWLLSSGQVSATHAQEPDRVRATTEATNQATEADRLYKLGEFAAALPIYEAERASRVTTRDLRYEAYALRAIGLCHAELGDDTAAIAAWRQAYALDIKRDDPGYAGYDDFLTAQAEARLGLSGDARKTLERALIRLNGAADRDHEIDARLVLARLLVDAGQAEPARIQATHALELAQKADDAWRIGDALASLGQMEGALNHPQQALDNFTRASKLFEQQARAADTAWMETISASALVLLNRLDEALVRYEKAANLHKHLDDGGSASEDLAAAAGLHLEAGRIDQALSAAQEAIDQARDADERHREVEARVRLAQVQGVRNEWSKAAETLDEAVILGRQIYRDDPFEQVRILLTAAATDARANKLDRTRERLEAANQVADDCKSVNLKQAVATTATNIRLQQIPSQPADPIQVSPPLPPLSSP